jgi:zinc transport system substrate-binding protein
MRTKIVIVLVVGSIAGALTAFATGCGSRTEQRESVVAGFYPLAFAASEIGGTRFEVENLTPVGAEPHDLEVSPKDVAAVQHADVVLLLGHGFQPQLESAAGRAKRVVKLLDTPGLGRFRNGDPHVWLDPVRFARIVERVGDVLGDQPAAHRLAARLRGLDGEYRAGLAHCAQREIVTGHEAFAYLSQRYALRQVAITGLSPEAEPSPRDLQRVIAVVRQTHARTVYTETLASPKISETAARETGARTAVLNPIEGLTPDEQRSGADYFTLMRQNLAALRKGLGCR